MVRKMVWLSVLIALSSTVNARAEDAQSPGQLLDAAIKKAREQAVADAANSDAGQALTKVKALETKVEGIDRRLGTVEEAQKALKTTVDGLTGTRTAATTTTVAKKPSAACTCGKTTFCPKLSIRSRATSCPPARWANWC